MGQSPRGTASCDRGAATIVEQLVYADNLTDAEQRIADYILGMLVGPNLGLVVANVSDTIADQVPNVLESECEDAALMEVYERYIAPDLAG